MNPFDHAGVNITFQANVVTEGFNRKRGGVFLSDGGTGVYLAHNGNIGGGTKGIGKKSFLENLAVNVLKLNGRTVSLPRL